MKLGENKLKEIQSKLKLNNCPNCGGLQNSLHEDAVNLISLGEKDGSASMLAPGHVQFPSVCVVCDSCGHIRLFSLNTLENS